MVQFSDLTDEDRTCPKCDREPIAVIEQSARGVEFRSDLFDGCKKEKPGFGIATYYLHLNQRP